MVVLETNETNSNSKQSKKKTPIKNKQKYLPLSIFHFQTRPDIGSKTICKWEIRARKTP